MKAIGIMRKVDSLGRIVIPKEHRDFLGITKGDPLEIVVTTEGIWLRKPEYEVRKKGSREAEKGVGE